MQSMTMAARLPASFQEQVVIQSGYQDDTKGLWGEIWNTLMGYINADDSPNKLQQKDVLVDLMSQFLSRVAHDSKFYLSCTPAVLRASFSQANFQPLSAAQAFEALHEYAVRILAQPWRAEFTQINMYSGYYVHTVQSRLLEAHRLLEEMGFRVDAASQTATLREPVDVDQVTKAAIDTLMASVECRIIERILECLPAGAYTPLGVLCYRSSYVGGVQAAVHHLNVTLRQRNFQRYFAPPPAAASAAVPELSGGTAAPAYPWEPAPAGAAPVALPPVPTARLVDVGEREPRDAAAAWIPKTIRQPRTSSGERPEPRAPPAAALLPATLDEHQLASWDLVDGASAAQTPQAAQGRQPPPPADSLDDSWGYVLNSLDRRRPASGRYDNVPELADLGQRAAGFQRSATLPASSRAEPRAPPRGGRAYSGAGQERQPYDPRPQLGPLPNGSAARNGAGPEPAAARQQQYQQQSEPAITRHQQQQYQEPAVTRQQQYQYQQPQSEPAPPRPPPPPMEAVTAPQRPPSYEYSDSVRGAAPADRSSAPRGSLPLDYQQPAPADSLMPRSSSLVSDQTRAPRTAASEQATAQRPAAAAAGRANGGDSGSSARRPASQRPSPRPEPSPEPAPAAGRPRASPPEPRRPEVGAWPSRAEPPAPSPPATPADDQWSCHACTYLNPVSVRVCAMCGKSRQAPGRTAPVAPAVAPPAEPPDDLACPQCTLLNSRRARKCGACEAELQPAK